MHRHDELGDAFAASLPLVRELIEEREVPPSRARYLDMPRLLDRMDADRFRVEPRWASIHCALQLLDFKAFQSPGRAILMEPSDQPISTRGSPAASISMASGNTLTRHSRNQTSGFPLSRE